MEKSLFNKYVEERYNDQMKYYSVKSGFNQKRYKKFQWVLIILSALTPVIAALSGRAFGSHTLPDLQFIVVVISSIVAILTTGLKTFNYQDLWINYRSTYESLKPEIYYYNFNVGPYGEPDIDKESLFVMRVETILDTEHKIWPSITKKKDDGNADAGNGGGEAQGENTSSADNNAQPDGAAGSNAQSPPETSDSTETPTPTNAQEAEVAETDAATTKIANQ